MQARHSCALHIKEDMKQTVFLIFTLVMTSEANAGAFGRAIAVGSGHTFGKYFTLGGAIAFAVAVMVWGGIIGYLFDHYNDD
jgi:hypothetical protein